MSHQDEVPTFFIDFRGQKIKVSGVNELSRASYRCPRACGTDTIEALTDAGLYLFCYGCRIFSPEKGHWGYKEE